MKQLLFYCFFILSPILINAQVTVSKDFKVTKGTPYEVVDATKKYYFSKGDEILTVKVDGKLVIIQKMSSKNLVFLKKTEFKDFPSGFDIEDILEFAGKYYLFYSYWQKPNEQLFVREIDFAKGEFIGEGKLIIKTDRKLTSIGELNGIVSMSYAVTGGMGMWMNFGVKDKFSFNKSFDQTKLIIQYRLKPEVKDDNLSYDIIGMNVFDPKMTALWKKEVTMPYTEKKMNNLDYNIDGEGNGYILTTVYDDNTTKAEKKKKPNYHIELLKVKAVTGVITKTPIQLNDKQITTIWIYENSNDHMVCAGYYCKSMKDINDADGIFMFKVDKNGKAYDVISHEIPVSVLNQYTTERQQKKNEKKDDEDKADFEDLQLRELKVMDDGSIVLIGEQYFTVTRTYYSSSGGSRTTTTIYYNDMLITKIGPKGELLWMQKLGKRQSRVESGNGIYTRRGGMSYQYMFQNGNHYLLFLDNKKNLELPLNKVPAFHSDGQGGFLTAYKVSDAKGAVSKLSLFDMRDLQGTEVYQFMTDRILPLSSNEFVIELYKKQKEDLLIKVSLPK